jgi:hypothetical protein
MLFKLQLMTFMPVLLAGYTLLEQEYQEVKSVHCPLLNILWILKIYQNTGRGEEFGLLGYNAV